MGRKAKAPNIQLHLGDRFIQLSKRGQDAIRKSSLGHFGDEIFPRINADDFMVLYSNNGRGPSYCVTAKINPLLCRGRKSL